MAEKPTTGPLPADLPENWTPGQIVSPDGTSVGLSEQHGYNYLMRMVNRAQRGINSLNDALAEVGGKRACRFTVGTSAAGWTEADCDYLCDGTNDQVEINQALRNLPEEGGEILLLSGTYQLSGGVSMENFNKNVSLRGNPGSTVLNGGGMRISVLFGVQKFFTCYLSGLSLENCDVICLDANLIVQSCEFTDCGISIAGFDNPAKYFFCQDNRFQMTKPDQMIGGYMNGDDSIVISGNVFRSTSGNVGIVAYSKSTDVENAIIFSENSVFCEEGEKESSIRFFVPAAFSRNNLVNCSLEACWGGTITGNRIFGGRITIEGVYLEDTSLNERNMSTISNNTIRDGRIIASGPVEILANVIMAASNDGDYAPISIEKQGSTSVENANPAVIGNFIFGGRYGICLEPIPTNYLNRVASHVLISSNRIFGSTTPVKLNAGWKYCMVTDNMFDTGSIVDGGTGNIIRYNSDDPGGGSGGSGTDSRGVPVGGAAGQVLTKRSGDNYDMGWDDPPGGGAAGVASFNGRSGAVEPASGDYTAEMVGARPDTWTPTARDVGAIAASAVTSIQPITQSEYDALAAKDPATLYLIKE